MTIPITLSIAGSDSSGGAGIQADLKTFSALKSYGCSVITAITAQNTQGVQRVECLSPEIIIAQCQSIFSDLTVSAIKTGMLGNAAIINALANFIDTLTTIPPLIIDPVLVSTSGHQLLEDNAIEILKNRLFPKAALITPNLPEAAILLDNSIPENTEAMTGMLESLLTFGNEAVLLKGGHLAKEKQSTDLYFNGQEILSVSAPCIDTQNTHGTGCSLSSAITAYYALGYSMKESIVKAKHYVHKGIAHAEQLSIGQGHGPIHHFVDLWK